MFIDFKLMRTDTTLDLSQKAKKQLFIHFIYREKNINVREKHQSVTSHMCHDRESNPQPRYMA